MRLGGAVAVVTGASSGIGAATAVAFAGRGARLVLVARRADKLAETVRACERAGARAVAVPADVADPGTPDLVVRTAEAELGPVDVLVNNAGLGQGRYVADTPLDDVRRIFEVNYFAPVALTLAVLPGMCARDRGSIVNVTSVSAYVPNPGEAAYGATKAALSRWTHGLALELHRTGVHAGVVAPGPIDTDMAPVPGEYNGKLHPPEVVAEAIVETVERQHVHRTAPRAFGLASAVYPILQRPFRWGILRFTEGAAQPPRSDRHDR